jgi:DNA-binding XRE family transcriptional regulator
MAFVLPKPKIMTRDGKPAEVILSYADWQKIVAVLDEDDADDIAAIEAARREDDDFAATLAAQRGVPVETTIPLEIVRAKLDGVHPLKAWREFRSMTQLQLSSSAGVGRDLIAQIETHKKRGGVGTLERLARALAVPIEALIAQQD